MDYFVNIDQLLLIMIQISLRVQSSYSNLPLPQCNVSIIPQDQIDHDPIQLNTAIPPAH